MRWLVYRHGWDAKSSSSSMNGKNNCSSRKSTTGFGKALYTVVILTARKLLVTSVRLKVLVESVGGQLDNPFWSTSRGSRPRKSSFIRLAEQYSAWKSVNLNRTLIPQASEMVLRIPGCR